MQKKWILGLIGFGLLVSSVLAAAEYTGNSNVNVVNPNCYIHKVDYGQDAMQFEKDGKVITMAGIYAQVRGEFIMPPCTMDPHLTWYATDAGDIPGALYSVYDFQVIDHDWRGASVDAYGSGLGRAWHAFAEVSLG
ncbi:hypothetical protein [Thermococcus sp. Bubb.Bath]|uniref:hypothetical protein n=1 Tax=Thermococcus sp. Bubb.Bath TaxID=1638242 RepID=UPI00143B2B31|nr:hypothetical protein [Thermococcus sp. Bubb.Bath]NJF24950.1 hypothetical protein [Thermococcus sp. Bubb.Bath]